MAPCVLCQRENFQKLFCVAGQTLKKCKDCGLVKTEKEQATSYQNYHRDKDYEKLEKHFENIFLKRVSIIEKFFPRPGRALEVGCSTGILLDLLKKKGWEVYGAEPSGAAKIAKKRGIEVRQQTFEKADIPRNSFDLIIFNHTLEHMEDPLLVLKKAYGLLKKNGRVFIDVPNFNSLSAVILGKNWPYILPDEHIFHFTHQTLSKLLEKSGFRVVFYQTHSGVFDFGNVFKGLWFEARHLTRNFVFDLITMPGALFTTLIGKGTTLTVVAERLSYAN